MMTAKEYVEGKVKSYTLLAERCKREAEEMDNVREILEEESGEITYA